MWANADLRKLVQDYRDLSPSSTRYLNAMPDVPEMLRILAANRPVVIKGFDPIISDDGETSASKSKGKGKGKERADYELPSTWEEIMGDKELSIAVTPNGLADSLQPEPKSGKTYFVQPLTEKMTMSSFISKLLHNNTASNSDSKYITKTSTETATATEDLASSSNDGEEILYLQSQNGNIYRHSLTDDINNLDTAIQEEEPRPELERLQGYIKSDVEVMTEALGRRPDAVNLWIGDKRSITTLHRDPYENIYHMLSGRKTFTLFSPIEGFCLDHDFYPTATWTRQTSSRCLEITPDSLDGSMKIPWTSVDPLNLDVSKRPVRPITITIQPGESLYLPAGWWHHVQQEEGDHGLCVAVNYWYDQTIHAQNYAYERFVWRSIGKGNMIGADDESSEFSES